MSCPARRVGSRARPSARGGRARTEARARVTERRRCSHMPSTGCARISASSASSSRPGFVSTSLADVHLADVVERRAEPQRLEPLLVPSQPDAPRPPRCAADSRGVPAERGVADLHGGRVGGESAHGASGSPRRGTLPVDFRAMRVCVPRESAPGEHRVALTPEAAGEAGAAGFDVVVERGAGAVAGFPDRAVRRRRCEPDGSRNLARGLDALVRVAQPAARRDRGARPGHGADRVSGSR